MRAVADERSEFHAGDRLFGEGAKVRDARGKPRVGDDGDVLCEQGAQPRPFAGLRIDKDHRAQSPAGIEGMYSVRSHDEPLALAPEFVLTANGESFVEGDDNLDRVVRMRRHDASRPADQQEATVPKVPARLVQPPVGCIV